MNRQITRVVQAISSVTSQVFRCHGLQRVPRNADRMGAHDIAYWIIFLSAVGGWFVFIYTPQRERLRALTERRQMLLAHMAADQREVQRYARSNTELKRLDPRAWERAARGSLQWVEPGEITDVEKWRKENPQARTTAPGQTPQNRTTPANAPVLPRPRIPAVPSSEPPPRTTPSHPSAVLAATPSRPAPASSRGRAPNR